MTGQDARRRATAETPQTPRRFLFVMVYPGYLRYFDSVLRLLVERGHHVDLVFDLPDKQPEGAEAIADLGGVEVLGHMPIRRGLWATVARGVRGAIDYVRYRHPDFRDAAYLRDRLRHALPGVLAWVDWRRTTSRGNVRRWVRMLQICERAIPSDPAIEAFIASRRPDAVVVTPLVLDRSPQVDAIKSARALGIPTALCVGSWDHLTTKGLMRVMPDVITVWNAAQLEEAAEYHFAPRERIVVTGAPPFDRWFTRQATPRAQFTAKVGLDAHRPFVLWVGSTASISAPDVELRFVRRWVETLRRDPAFCDVGILIRPHPYNIEHWRSVSFDDCPDVVVYPRRANPVNEADRQDYFDSLTHCAAVVGVNTTAMIEAAIAGKTVHSVLADEFRETQGGTLHFRYLLAEHGGFLRVAGTLEAHAEQLADTLHHPEAGRDACARFVAQFVRPNGVNAPATPLVTDALEQLTRVKRPAPQAVPAYLQPLGAALWAIAFVSVYRHPVRAAAFADKQRRIFGKKMKNARKTVTRWVTSPN
ncbi:MAG TPA: hypothetical protein VL173_08425 [Vicinamibacterales bacterium]|jgi:hypothetical protein|nr:hypothetical protein [Vicinamibacterales bacterium]